MLLLVVYTTWTYTALIGLCRTVSAAVVWECYTHMQHGGARAAAGAPPDISVAAIPAGVLARHLGTLLAAAALAPVAAVLRAVTARFLTPRQMVAWCAPQGRRGRSKQAQQACYGMLRAAAC